LTKKIKKRSVLFIAVLLILGVGFAVAVRDNTALMVSNYQVSSEKLPEEFDGFRIAQISDLHNAEFGEENIELTILIEQNKPDIIVLTGDFIDSNRTDVNVAVSFAKKAVEIAPVYFAAGNHEERAYDSFVELQEQLETCGVHVLRNNSIIINRNGAEIQICGVDDPAFAQRRNPYSDANREVELAIKLAAQPDLYTVLLSHRPELFEIYVESGADLVFSGHAHGGQFRLPFVGGVVAPGQGLFPEYDAGVFEENGTAMVVSRGLGNSIIPLRVNNRPELVVVTLNRTKKGIE